MGSAEVNGTLWGARAQDWAELQEVATRPLVDAVHDRVGLGPGVRCLDLACGAGLACALAADRGAEATGVDASEAMIACARKRAPAARFQVADLEALPFPGAAFDLATSFNGVQYAADWGAALREIRRVLGPGGQLALAVWGQPEGMAAAAVIGALRPLLPAPPPGAPGPFALSDPEALRRLVDAGGFGAEATVTIDAPLRYAGLDAAVRGFDASGVAERARAASGAPAVTAAHRAALQPFVRADGSVEIGASFLLLLARRR